VAVIGAREERWVRYVVWCRHCKNRLSVLLKPFLSTVG
jgi:hypothetical protein